MQKIASTNVQDTNGTGAPKTPNAGASIIKKTAILWAIAYSVAVSGCATITAGTPESQVVNTTMGVIDLITLIAK